MIFCIMTTESQTEKIVVWEEIEREVLTLDSPQRGTSNRDGAFVTLLFTSNGTDHEFMQCTSLYPKQESFFSKLFRAKQGPEGAGHTYSVEAKTGEKIYTKEVKTSQEAAAILQAYYLERKLPNLSDWVDSGIL